MADIRLKGDGWGSITLDAAYEQYERYAARHKATKADPLRKDGKLVGFIHPAAALSIMMGGQEIDSDILRSEHDGEAHICSDCGKLMADEDAHNGGGG